MDEEAIFLRAVECRSRAQQLAFLEQACGNNADLRADVESLLEHHTLAGRFLENLPAECLQTLTACQGETIHTGRDDLSRLLDASEQPGCLGRLGPYEVLEVINRGGMGMVLRARDSKLDREVAIKVMSLTDATSQAVQRLVREARAAAAVKHPNVVTVYSVCDDGQVPYIVMELVHGVSLQQRLDQHGPLELREILQLGEQIAAGLEAAHQCGLTHRDIKPANILLESGTGNVKITDFGLARAADDGRLTQEGQIAGTPQFMSPEQARGKEADQRSDLFSLGCVLYAMCTGASPFASDSTVATLRAICDDAPPRIRGTHPGLPTWLEAVILRLLDKDPQKRPKSAREVAELFGRKLQEWTSSSLPVTTQRSPHKVNWLVRGVALVLLAAVVVIVVKQNGKSTRVEVPDGSVVQVGPERVDVQLSGTAQANSVVTPSEQPDEVRQVVAQLMKLNPGFDGQVESRTTDGQVTELRLCVDNVKDLSPLKALPTLISLACTGSSLRSGILADLSPLRGLKLCSLDCANTQVADLSPLGEMPLGRLNLANARVEDLTPLRDISLTELYVQGTLVKDLSPLKEMPLIQLNCSQTQVIDLSPLRGAKLISLYCDETRIADFSPLAHMPLRFLNWRLYDYANEQHQKVLRSITTLESINGQPAAEFWAEVDMSSN